MPIKGRGQREEGRQRPEGRERPEGTGQRAEGRGGLAHVPALLMLAGMSIVWTWPLVLHFGDHIPGVGGDNYSFLWNLWWMRTALSAPDLEFFHSNYLLSP